MKNFVLVQQKKVFLPFVDYREQVAGINLSREKISYAFH